jgi:hypothetical protein
MTEPQVIDGPTAPSTGQVIYQITLAKGLILTNPAAFGSADDSVPSSDPVFSEDGKLLAP